MSAVGGQAYLAIVKADPGNPKAIPSTPTMQKVNFTSEDLTVGIQTRESNHIRPDRATTDIAQIGIEIGGGYDFEFQYENSLDDELLLAAIAAEQWTVGGDLDDIAKNGAFFQPFIVEKGHTDIAQYFRYLGMVLNEFSLSFPDQDAVTGRYSFVGMGDEVGSAPIVGASYTEQASTQVFSTVTHITEIAIDGVPLTDCAVQSMDVTMNNNANPKTGLGTFGACGVNLRRFQVGGTITMYLEDAANYARLKNGTAFSIAKTLEDAAGNTYKLTYPRVKLSSWNAPIADENEVFDNMAWSALYDETEECVVKLERAAA